MDIYEGFRNYENLGSKGYWHGFKVCRETGTSYIVYSKVQYAFTLNYLSSLELYITKYKNLVIMIPVSNGVWLV